MLKRTLQITLVVTSLFFAQMSVAEAQIKTLEKSNTTKSSNSVVGEWVLKEARIDPKATDTEKSNLKDALEGMKSMIGKITMSMKEGGEFMGGPDGEVEKGTWRYDKLTKKLYIKINGEESPQNAVIVKDELQISTDQMTNFMIVFKRK